MSGIADRVHVFRYEDSWCIEAPTGQAFFIPYTAGLTVTMGEAMTLHDHPEVIHMLTTTDKIVCPICVRHGHTY